MAAITICSDFGAQKIKSDTVSIVSPSISHEVMGPDAMILVFWMLSFKLTYSLSSYTFIKRLFSSSSLSAIRVVSSAYLRLLIFLPAILIPACASSSPAFLMMYSAYKLNNQGDNICTALTYSFPDLQSVCCSMSRSNCCFLTCTLGSQETGIIPIHFTTTGYPMINIPLLSPLSSGSWLAMYNNWKAGFAVF